MVPAKRVVKFKVGNILKRKVDAGDAAKPPKGGLRR